jgi:hypothetical protein
LGDYKRRRAPEERERLILHYAPLGKFVAGRVSRAFPRASTRPTS